MTDDGTDERSSPAAGTERRHRRIRAAVRWTAVVLASVLVVMQFVPYGWHHSNPAVVQDAPWPDAESKAIARQSCYACHSNETEWPIYSYVAPMSWLVRRDVDRGRDELNFSRWDQDADEADKAARVVRDGAMPPSQYTLIHRSAALTDDEVAVLVAALESMDDHGSGGNGSGNDGSGEDD